MGRGRCLPIELWPCRGQTLHLGPAICGHFFPVHDRGLLALFVVFLAGTPNITHFGHFCSIEPEFAPSPTVAGVCLSRFSDLRLSATAQITGMMLNSWRWAMQAIVISENLFTAVRTGHCRGTSSE